MDQEDYASDSDQSDEDFCPEKEAGIADSDAESVEASGDDFADDYSSAEEEQKSDTSKHRQTKKKCNASSGLNSKAKPTKMSSELEDLEKSTSRRSTRQAADINGSSKRNAEKTEIESDDDEKSRTDALWADFLSDVKPASSDKIKSSIPKKVSNGDSAISTQGLPKHCETLKSKATEEECDANAAETSSAKTIEVTEILDFAGEEVRVKKTVTTDSIKENKLEQIQSSKSTPKFSGSNLGSPMSGLIASTKRSASSGGLGSILNQIGKKKKISVLEKTKLDWNNFKQDEGIEEELQTFNKGKDGYLERQDFLQRTDLRQFEREKVMRQSTKRNV